jgi:hypothetical protein
VRVLFDQGTPAPLRRLLIAHAAETAYERVWSELRNDELLAEAEQASYEVLVTTDLSLRYQPNLSERQIAIVVLSTTSWPRTRSAAGQVAASVDSPNTVMYTQVDIP